MSTKSTILLTRDNEHWYHDCSESLSDDPYSDAIVLEFSKDNIRIDVNDYNFLILTIINPDCDIYGIIETITHKMEASIENLLGKLTKEDLIKVIANMHDTIQEWDNGCGISSAEAETLIKIGSACVTECVKTNDFGLPSV